MKPAVGPLFESSTLKYKVTDLADITEWAISNNGFRSDSLYEKKIGEDLVLIMPYQSLNNKHKLRV